MKRFFIYRNLHKGTFSIRYDGKVVAYMNRMMLPKTEFRVNEGGRKRVLESGQKNIHAFAISHDYHQYTKDTKQFMDDVDILQLERVTYNPFIYKSFVDKAGLPVIGAKAAYLFDGEIWAYQLRRP